MGRILERVISAMAGLGIVLGLSAVKPARADHRDLALFVAPILVETGLLAFLLPRFSLKTGVGVHVEPLANGATLPTGAVILRQSTGTGALVLRGLGQDFSLVPGKPDNPAAARFVSWLMSDIGQRTIAQFAVNDAQVFTGAAGSGPTVQAVPLAGNVVRGETLAYDNCGRCHVIGVKNRMKGIGSTPSFGLLRSFDDWQDRFRAFYALNPHPSFSQISGVTPPFDANLPPPISPLFLTPGDLDDIIAFVDSLRPADLGAPLIHQ